VKTATDGSEKPAAILVDNVDASTTDQNGGLYLMGEFNQNHIILITPGPGGNENCAASAGYFPERQHSGPCSRFLI
jgi:hypothetical protein